MLYKYLENLGVGDIESEYKILAENGRYKIQDIRAYYSSKFQPSSIEDVKDEDLEQIVDYYSDLKTVKNFGETKQNQLLKDYKQNNSQQSKQLVIANNLKDVLHICLNYKTMHKDVNIQDLVQTANLALFKAVEKYKCDAKIPFKDYVVYWVAKEITKEFEEKQNG